MGLEGDFDLSGLRGSRTAPCIAPFCGALAATFTQKVPWFGTIRPPIGYAAGNWLLYATGGYAYAQLDTNAIAAVGPLVAANNRNETRNGWTLGGGVEVEFASHWSAKIEYLYVDLGRSTTTFLVAPSSQTRCVSTSASYARAWITGSDRPRPRRCARLAGGVNESIPSLASAL